TRGGARATLNRRLAAKQGQGDEAASKRGWAPIKLLGRSLSNNHRPSLASCIETGPVPCRKSATRSWRSARNSPNQRSWTAASGNRAGENTESAFTAKTSILTSKSTPLHGLQLRDWQRKTSRLSLAACAFWFRCAARAWICSG